MGLEGERVRVLTLDGQQRTFVVALSKGWLPHHVEIRDDGTPVRADHDYQDACYAGGRPIPADLPYKDVRRQAAPSRLVAFHLRTVSGHADRAAR